jgi:hypothetical protein
MTKKNWTRLIIANLTITISVWLLQYLTLTLTSNDFLFWKEYESSKLDINAIIKICDTKIINFILLYLLEIFLGVTILYFKNRLILKDYRLKIKTNILSLTVFVALTTISLLCLTNIFVYFHI